jgi:hypothetical protein
MDDEHLYVVYFKNNGGYFSKNQSGHDWVFTENINEAKIYDSYEGAAGRKKHGENPYLKYFGKIIEVKREIIITKKEEKK